MDCVCVFVLTAINSITVAQTRQSFFAPTVRVACTGPGVVVIGTRPGLHLFFQDHSPDPSLDLEKAILEGIPEACSK